MNYNILTVCTYTYMYNQYIYIYIIVQIYVQETYNVNSAGDTSSFAGSCLFGGLGAKFWTSDADVKF